MSAVKIARSRMLRAKNEQPLTLDQVRGVAPAVFQDHAYFKMSPQYAYIPTITVLEALLDQGFHIHEVAQARPYKQDRDPYAKHMVRMRYPLAKNVKVGDIVPEVVLVNAHDGTARYYLYAGLYRLVCSNGMIVGDTFASIQVAHRGGDITRSRVLEGSYSIVNDEMPKVQKQVTAMKERMLKPAEAHNLAQSALELRYPGMVPPFQAEDLLTIHREEDQALDLWHVMNVIQENVMQGGFQGRSFMYQRRTTARPVERVNLVVGINRGLWNAAASLLA